ncbi:MAG: protein TolR [Rhodocyclaceae bacterium]|nr:protein TolR [Rhodocyclaceae bacterium]
MRERRLMNQINVVPYIDVMLVLLVIFMVTAPMIQVGAVDLPSVGKASQVSVDPIEVIVAADGSLALRERGDQPRKVAAEDLIAELRRMQQGDADQPVLIAGDKSVRYEAVLDVMDLLQREGIRKIGLLVQPGKT